MAAEHAGHITRQLAAIGPARFHRAGVLEALDMNLYCIGEIGQPMLLVAARPKRAPMRIPAPRQRRLAAGRWQQRRERRLLQSDAFAFQEGDEGCVPLRPIRSLAPKQSIDRRQVGEI